MLGVVMEPPRQNEASPSPIVLRQVLSHLKALSLCRAACLSLQSLRFGGHGASLSQFRSEPSQGGCREKRRKVSGQKFNENYEIGFFCTQWRRRRGDPEDSVGQVDSSQANQMRAEALG